MGAEQVNLKGLVRQLDFILKQWMATDGLSRMKHVNVNIYDISLMAAQRTGGNRDDLGMVQVAERLLSTQGRGGKGVGSLK